jgi:hypothetical protein
MAGVTDFLGREIHPGQTLVYAALGGRSAVLKLGHVITVGDNQKITVEIDSEKRTAGGYVPVKRRVVLTFPERCVVIETH